MGILGEFFSGILVYQYPPCPTLIRELIPEKGSVLKVRQFSKSLEEGRDKAQELQPT